MLIGNRVSTWHGQPSATIYDWILGIGMTENGEKLSLEISHRLLIAKFCDRVTKNLYNNPSDLVGLVAETEQPTITAILKTELRNLDTLAVQFSRKFVPGSVFHIRG